MQPPAPDATQQYWTGQARPGHPALMEAFQKESDAIVATLHPVLDVRYGGHQRETFDFFRSTEPWRGTLAYWHAGYWQSRDKSLFRFLAPAFLTHGIDVALVNYPLCPDVTLAAIIDTARAAVPAILAHAAALGRGGTSLVASGHSAGGHLSVELALTDWAALSHAASPIAGVAALSGVFDLEPLLNTPINDKLRLDPTTARALSPLHRVCGPLPPALFAVGGAETPAFLGQNEATHRAWLAAGQPGASLVIEGADHFTLLRALQRPGALLTGVMDLFKRMPPTPTSGLRQ